MSAYRDLVVDTDAGVAGRTYMTVDVEDYYHEVPGGEEAFYERGLPSNVARNVERLLDLFAEQQVTATFFVLGTVADRLRPQLARIVAEGHELGSHGYAHGRLTWMERDAVREDIRRAKATLEDAAGVEVRGYRAPYFSVTEQTLWALDEIRDAGHAYDSSVCPVQNFAYGIPDAPEQPHRLANGLLEFPLPQTTLFGYRLMVGGGFYLRAYPFPVTQWLLRHRDPALPRIFYIHPWEMDDRRLNLWDQGVDLPGLRWKPRTMKLITTFNRRRTFPRLERLLSTWHGEAIRA